MQYELKQLAYHLYQGYLSSLIKNGLVVVIAYYLLFVLFKDKLKKYKINKNHEPSLKQISSEMRNGLLVFFISACFYSLGFYLRRFGITKYYSDYHQYGLAWSVASFFIVWAIHETWFYWIHRLMHKPFLYYKIHYLHHESVEVNPLSGLSFHVLENLLVSIYIIPIAMVIPIYGPGMFIYFIINLIINLYEHCGYEFFPNWYLKSIFRYLIPSTFHHQHHTPYLGNYGAHFRFWDKWMGTEFPDFEETFLKVKLEDTEDKSN